MSASTFAFEKFCLITYQKYVIHEQRLYLHVNNNSVNVAHTAFCVCKQFAYACLLKANKENIP